MRNDIHHDITLFTHFTRSAYFDRSCRYYSSRFYLLGYSIASCMFNCSVCLGHFCDLYESISFKTVKPQYVQLKLF